MTNEQTIVEIMKLDQTGMGGLTAEGEKKLQEMIQSRLAEEQTGAHTPKEYAYLYTRLLPSKDKARTKA